MRRAGRSASPSSAGSIVSQLITLYLTPVVYTYMATMFKTRKIPGHETGDSIETTVNWVIWMIG